MSNQELQAGALLQGGKYRIDSILGQGGFGITYLATQTQLGRYEAIKEFFLRDLCERRDGTDIRITAVTQTEMVERYKQKFKKEAMMLAGFDHQNIVHVHDVFEENGTWYYSMDYIEGRTLDDIIKERGRLPEAEALFYIQKIGEALDYIHARRVNHLDIKPSNIMVRTADSMPVLIDFGISKQYDEKKNETSTTPPGISKGYSPLEQYRAGGVSTFLPQSDIYALGATLYRMVTGQTPPEASDVLNAGITGIPADVSPRVRNAIVGAMQPRTTDRIPTVQGFMQVLAGQTGAGTSEQTVRAGSYNPSQPPVAPPPFRPVQNSGSPFLKVLCLILFLFAVILSIAGIKKCSQNKDLVPAVAADSAVADSAVVDSDSVAAPDVARYSGEEETKPATETPAEQTTETKTVRSSSSYTLYGEMVGFPMTVDIKFTGGNSFMGTYHNTTYGTKMRVSGSVSNGRLLFTGRLQGSTYTFELYETSGSDFQPGKEYRGACYVSNGTSKNLWLTVQ